MSDDTYSFFEVEQTISGVVRKLPKHSTTAVVRSNCLFAPALSTLVVHISATATVVVKSNAFGETAKDATLTTLSATGRHVIASADKIVLDVTANTGTVTAILICNED
jgi:hypothetical protein